MEREMYLIYSNLLLYLWDFQKYNMQLMREMDGIESIINAIPHNQGFLRNGISFDESFDCLVTNEQLLSEVVILFQKEKGKDGSSLSDFLVFLDHYLNQCKIIHRSMLTKKEQALIYEKDGRYGLIVTESLGRQTVFEIWKSMRSRLKLRSSLKTIMKRDKS